MFLELVGVYLGVNTVFWAKKNPITNVVMGNSFGGDGGIRIILTVFFLVQTSINRSEKSTYLCAFPYPSSKPVQFSYIALGVTVGVQ